MSVKKKGNVTENKENYFSPDSLWMKNKGGYEGKNSSIKLFETKFTETRAARNPKLLEKFELHLKFYCVN